MQALIQIFKQNKGYLRSKELSSRPMRYQLELLMKQHLVSRIKRGVYCLNAEASKQQIIDVERIVPGGVLCLYSAWSYYNLTLNIPDAYYVAIEKSRKVTLPAFPAIKVIYLKREYFELGIDAKVIEGIDVRIYDMEKCVCDAVKYRNKAGMDITSEVIKNYLALKNRNIDKLVKYAREMRVYNTLKMYIEVQL